jgi:hypothetical protein
MHVDTALRTEASVVVSAMKRRGANEEPIGNGRGIPPVNGAGQ